MILVKNDLGKSVSISINLLEFLVSFDIGWLKGEVKGKSSEERLTDFLGSIDLYRSSKIQEVNFINNDGNIEIKLKKLTNGQTEFTATLIPSMIDEDQLHFELVGILDKLT